MLKPSPTASEDFDLFSDDDAALTAALITRKSLVDTHNRLGAMLDVMPMGLLIHTEQGVLFANQEACRLLKVERERVLGQHFLDYVRASDLEPVSEQFRTSFLGATETLDQEIVIERPDGTQRLVKLISGRLPWEGNPVIQILLQDITDQKRAENSLRQLTITDELTGAYNRRHAFYEAALYIESGTRTGIDLSVVIIDIDHFKKINDEHGHAIGDLALKALTRAANALLPTIEGTDSAMFARIGGEEFVMLLPGIELKRAIIIAERFRLIVERMRTTCESSRVQFTASMGIGTYRASDRNFDGLLSRADSALYRAKTAGRNQVFAAD